MSDLLKALTNLRPDIEATCGDTYESIQVLNGVTAPDKADLMAELERLSTIESTVKDVDAFRMWRRQNAAYRAWRAANIADVMALEFDIDKGDLDSALITWNLMDVAPEMQSLLIAKLAEFGYHEVLDKLGI